MNIEQHIDLICERVSSFVRNHVLYRLLNNPFGSFGEKVGQWIVLLFFMCFIRPTDLTQESKLRLPFKQFGLVYALLPATLYAAASAAFFKELDARAPSPPSNASVPMLLLFLGMGNIIKGLSFVMILTFIYAYGILRWLYTLSICAALGRKRTNAERASLAYFLLKSCANVFLFASFAWLASCVSRNT